MDSLFYGASALCGQQLINKPISHATRLTIHLKHGSSRSLSGQLQEDSHARWFDLNKRFKLELKWSRTFETRSNGVLRLSKCLIISKF